MVMGKSSLKAVDLRTEHLTSPQGVVREHPELSWKVAATAKDGKNLMQSGYRVLVSSDPGQVSKGVGDMWDSGVVESDATYGIEYSGKALPEDRPFYWSVQVRDQSGNWSDWSKPAEFSTGLRSASDWQGSWIGTTPPLYDDGNTMDFSGAKWIWSHGAKAGQDASAACDVSTTVEIGKTVKSAITWVTADDQFELWVNDEMVAGSSGKTDSWKTPVRVDLSQALVDGSNKIEVKGTNAAGQAGVLFKTTVVFTDGTSKTVSSGEGWTDADGQAAGILGNEGMQPWGRMEGTRVYPAMYYRKAFTTKPQIKRATAYVTALGLVDLYLNGARVSDELFTPGWTDYDKRVYYRCYDVTKRLKSGENVVGAVLGDGWYSGYVGYGHHRDHYGQHPKVRAEVRIEYTDGHTETVSTDSTWKCSTGGILTQDFLMGENFDANQEPKGWSSAGFDDSKWDGVTPSDEEMAISVHPGPPVHEYERIKFKTARQLKPGVWILDFEQNLAGFLAVKMEGKPGQTVTFRYVEKLDDKGDIYTANLRGAKATDVYTFDASGKADWTPRFTFHGFQYVQVEGLDRAPKPGEIQAVAISSATPEVGHIETSDPMLNRLALNAWWTQKMNFIDIPTDCPQRDERLGWTGDAQVYISTASKYSDVQSFFTKWLLDLQDGQRADGEFPMVAPVKVAGDDGGPAWADAGVICPWTIYEVYGDKRELAERYDSMKKFVEFTRGRAKENLLPPDNYHCFGDWVSLNADTPHDVIFEAYFAYSTSLVAKAAAVLGRTGDAAHYSALADQVKAAFNKAYVGPDGVVKGDTQCGQVLALAFDLVDGEVAKKAANHLIKLIEDRDWHLSTGFVGTRDLMPALSKIGRTDIAFRLLHNTDYPSWLFEVKNGATTVWERWDGWTPDKGFQDPGMNSFAHYAYGAVMGWVYEHVGGIKPLEAGYAKVLVSPQIDPHLTFSKCSYDSIRGPIACDWSKKGKTLTVKVTVPANATAVIRVPGSATSKDGLKGSSETGYTEFEAGSGTWEFSAPLN